jgi:two-component system, OmpR family, response regulator
MRILLVEDDSRIADFIQRGLKAEGYSIEMARTGHEAIGLASEGQFHAIILAIGLPDINGREVCGRLRSNGIDTPILMLTARDTVQDKVNGLRSGSDDYMTKPFAFEELLARIEALMRRHGTEIKPETRELQIADLILNGDTHAVRRGNTLIDLTPKEFALLECFMRAPGKVLSRTRILEQVWGYSADPLTNVVDVYIRQLRRKIDDDFDLKLLKTVRGFGYKLDIS